MAKNLNFNGQTFKDTKSVRIDGQTFRESSEVINIPTESVDINSNGVFDVTKYKTANVSVNSSEKIQESKTVTPTKQTQNVSPDSNYTALRKIVVNPIPDNYIEPQGTKTITSNGKGIDVKSYEYVDVNTKNTGSNLQIGKVVTPTKAQQSVSPDAGYDGFFDFTVEKIPDEYVIPSGTKTIKNTGTHDVSGFQYAFVDVEGGSSSIQPVSGSVIHGKFKPSNADNVSGAGIEIPINGYPSQVIVHVSPYDATNIDAKKMLQYMFSVKNGGGSSGELQGCIGRYVTKSADGTSTSAYSMDSSDVLNPSYYNNDATSALRSLTCNGQNVKFKTYGDYAFQVGTIYEYWIIRDERVNDPADVAPARNITGRFVKTTNGSQKRITLYVYFNGSEFTNNEGLDWVVGDAKWHDLSGGGSGNVAASQINENVEDNSLVVSMYTYVNSSSMDINRYFSFTLGDVRDGSWGGTGDMDDIHIKMENLTFSNNFDYELQSSFDASTNTYTLRPVN